MKEGQIERDGRKTWITKKCICGTLFWTRMDMPSVYCSRKCMGKNQSAEKHPSWKGGFYIHKGYLRHSHGGRKLLHREIVEKLLGRKLERSEVIHHIDGNTMNNDISNLKVISQSEHVAIHKKERSCNCSVCGKEGVEYPSARLCRKHYQARSRE